MTLKQWLVGLVISGLILSTTTTFAHGLERYPKEQKYPVITAQNASQLTQVGLIGRGYVTQVAWSPDGTSLAVAGATGVWLYTASAFNQTPRQIAEQDAPINAVVFSPDGSELAYGGKTVVVWNFKTGQRRLFPPQLSDTVAGLAFSPDGNWFVTVSNDRKIRVWDTNTGRSIMSCRKTILYNP